MKSSDLLVKTDEMRKKDIELVNIGRVGGSVGLWGELRVTVYAQDSENLKEGKVLLLKHLQKNGESSDFEAKCTGVRYQKDRPVIRIEGVNDRNAADRLRNMEIYINASDLEKLPEGEHYVRDIIGYTVIDIAGTETDQNSPDNTAGEKIGILADVIQNTSQSILDVRTEDGRQILIPAVDAFLRNIDDERQVIEVELIPGFI